MTPVLSTGNSSSSRQASVVSEQRCYDLNVKPSLESFKKITSQTATSSAYPLATDIQKNIPIYDLTDFDLTDKAQISMLQDEWYRVLLTGPGTLVLQNMYTDIGIIDRANEAFQKIILKEKKTSKGDHFSKGKNDRIWNSYGKHALVDPESFVQYYSNPWMKVISEAYLGSAYRLTSQVNIVKPGGDAQIAHRDYHLGFQTADSCVGFPISMQIASQLLTLQGAVAHSDMPLESGPTRLLPFSQTFEGGYMAYRLDEFTEYFLSSYVSLPLKKGDGLFFNPALFHAAGNNRTSDFNRSANLIQVSSAMGKPMENVDTISIVKDTWPFVKAKFDKEGFTTEMESLVNAIAEGYPFPSNLDNRPPAIDGMAPESEQDIVRRGLAAGWTAETIFKELSDMRKAESGFVDPDFYN
ncbi:hypothetical protein V1511DRAFT_189522 [Dipodascopsis uninucleata]